MKDNHSDWKHVRFVRIILVIVVFILLQILIFSKLLNYLYCKTSLNRQKNIDESHILASKLTNKRVIRQYFNELEKKLKF